MRQFEKACLWRRGIINGRETRMNTKEYLRKEMLDAKKDALETLAETKLALCRLSSSKLSYTVGIDSLWAVEGEKPSSCTGKPGESLAKLIVKAQRTFMEINRRSDVQGRYTVSVCAAGWETVLPEKFWIRLTKRKTKK